ncbi:MAG: CHRD domain-containing protein [Pseudonocardiaceae bacterium]
MQHSTALRKMGRLGACLAFASSILVFAGPAAASAHEGYPAYPAYYDWDGEFLVELDGDELRDGGDRYGRGVAGLDFDPERQRVCYFINWERLDGAVTAFHLYRAPRREDGPHWIDLFDDKYFDGDRNTVASCVYASRRDIFAVLDRPSEFYLNLHTTAHRHGALRGQLN